LHFRSNTAVDQLKEVEMLRPLRLFLGLSGINQQSLCWRSLPRLGGPCGCSPVAREPAGTQGGPHVAHHANGGAIMAGTVRDTAPDGRAGERPGARDCPQGHRRAGGGLAQGVSVARHPDPARRAVRAWPGYGAGVRSYVTDGVRL